MDEQAFREELLATFLEELQIHTETIGSELLALEKDPPKEQRTASWANLFRSAHTLKGAAAVVDIPTIATACHCMEDIFTDYRDNGSVPSAELTSKLLAAVDAIEEIGMRMRAEQSLDDAPLGSLLSDLQTLASKSGGAAESSGAPQSAGASESREASGSGGRSDDGAGDPDDTDLFEVDEPLESPTLAESEAEIASRPELLDTNSTADSETAPKQPQVHADAARPDASADDSRQTDVAASVKHPLTMSEGAAAGQVGSIRVPAEKLDTLLAHSGELLVARGRLAFRAGDAATLRDLTHEIKTLWKQTTRSLGELIRSNDLKAHPKRYRKEQTRLRIESLVQTLDHRVAELTQHSERHSGGLEADNRFLKQACNLLDDEIYHVRMLPFADACGGLDRAVRKIATSTGKSVQLEIVGAEVEVDRSVLEGLKDPLLHLVRNAVDHGIESPDVREASGKPARAAVAVSAALKGDQVEVRVEDDGGGLDLKRVCETARKRNLAIPDDPREQARLIFHPGFSTARMITDISGRGVGLDVVQSQVESLHGAVDVSFQPGAYTRFSLHVPLTLTTIRSLLVQVCGQMYAIPTTAVERLIRFAPGDSVTLAGREALMLDGNAVILASLADTLGVAEGERAKTMPSKRLAVVLAAGEQRVAVTVDDVAVEQEVLVKNLGARVRRLRHFSGCTLLPTGRIALVMNAANVVRSALAHGPRHSKIAVAPNESLSTKSLLLVEDSVTTRVLLKNILQAAGYLVTTAADGSEAWQAIESSAFDLVVTDVDMPVMDGFALTRKIRNSEKDSGLPVVLVTARGSDRDRSRGLEVGANAYIVKQDFEQQNLLDTIAQLV